MVASGKIRTKSLKSAKFQFQLFLTTLDIMGSLYRKIFVVVSIHIAIQTSKYLNENKNRWCFEIVL